MGYSHVASCRDGERSLSFIDLVKLSLGKVEFHYLIADFDCYFSFDLAEYTTYRRTVKRVKIKFSRYSRPRGSFSLSRVFHAKDKS